MEEVVLETEILLEQYGEDNTPYSPIEIIARDTDTVNDVLYKINAHLYELKTKYPGYISFRYSLEKKYYGFGTHSFWYDLIGMKE